jgi:hypothetical protein
VLSRHLIPIDVVMLVLVLVLMVVLPIELVPLGRWCLLLLLAPTIHPVSSGSQGWGWVLGRPSLWWGAGPGAGPFLIDVGPCSLVLSS